MKITKREIFASGIGAGIIILSSLGLPVGFAECRDACLDSRFNKIYKEQLDSQVRQVLYTANYKKITNKLDGKKYTEEIIRDCFKSNLKLIYIKEAGKSIIDNMKHNERVKIFDDGTYDCNYDLLNEENELVEIKEVRDKK